jgi:LPXTG-motif cell wall-anchored protein
MTMLSKVGIIAAFFLIQESKSSLLVALGLALLVALSSFMITKRSYNTGALFVENHLSIFGCLLHVKNVRHKL